MSLIDRWKFRKIIIKEITIVDSERRLLKTKTVFFFGLIRTSMEYVEYQGKYYSKFSNSEVSTHEVEPRFIDKALLKYNLEK
jgi:hypothetical protein